MANQKSSRGKTNGKSQKNNTTKSRKTTTTKKSSTSSRKNTNSEQKKYEEQDELNLVNELILIGIIGLFIFLFLCVIGVISSKDSANPNIGDYVKYVMYGIFGVTSYIIPIFLPVVLAVGYFSQKGITKIKLSCVCVIFAIIGFFTHFAAFKDLADYTHVDDVIKTIYESCGGNGSGVKGGGILFGLPASYLADALGTFGSIFMLSIILIACFLVITGKSLIKFLQTSYDKATYEHEDNCVNDDYEEEDEYEGKTRNIKQGFFSRLLGGFAYDDEAEDTVAEEYPEDDFVYVPRRERNKNNTSTKLRHERKGNGVTFNTDLKSGHNSTSFDTNNNIEVISTASNSVESASLIVNNPPVNEAVNVQKEIHQKKESPVKKDIHQVKYTNIDTNIPDSVENDDDWIKPISKKITPITLASIEREENEILFAEESNNTRNISEVVIPEAQETANDIIKPVEEKTTYVKPKAVKAEVAKSNPEATVSLRSRDKGQLTKSLGEIKVNTPNKHREYVFPTVDLLSKPANGMNKNDEMEIAKTAENLVNVLKAFGVTVNLLGYSKGPAVTRYELQPATGVPVKKITNLADDIKLNLGAADIRIEAPIPGKQAVGIEVPNKDSSAVSFRDLVDSKEFNDSKAGLCFAVGKDISGERVIADISKMPHVLIAGATGSGKSVCINTLIMSLLYKYSPDEVKMIMIDPKVVELSVYNGLPHLLKDVVTDPKQAAAALKWGVAEMSRRYTLFNDASVRDLKGYNEKAMNGEVDADGAPIKFLPKIIIIVDELADLMMVAGKECEESICRLAQLARACGIHLVIATQRPSVDVITGLIKANMPSRIAFAVSSGIDSRTIIDNNGAEKLLGKGDMLFFPQGMPKPARVQGCFVSDKEVINVCDFIRQQEYRSLLEEDNNTVDFDKFNTVSNDSSTSDGASNSNHDEHFEAAGKLIIEKQNASIGYLQRFFQIGFNRAARIMDQLEEAGVVGASEGTKSRQILMTLEEFDNYLNNN